MLDVFEKIVRQRCSCRQFEKKAIPAALMKRLLEDASQAPSGYNLQPIHYIVLQEEEIRKKIFPFCLKQNQILDASAIVVFAADRKVAKHNGEAVVVDGLRRGCFNEAKAKSFLSFLKLGFTGWWKRYLAPVIRFRAILPQLPIENMDAWLAKHAGLSSMTFMLAATAAGLSTCPMEAFDEKKLKKALKLDSSWNIPIIVAVGYGKPTEVRTSRLPLSELVTWR